MKEYLKSVLYSATAISLILVCLNFYEGRIIELLIAPEIIKYSQKRETFGLTECKTFCLEGKEFWFCGESMAINLDDNGYPIQCTR